MLLYQMYFEIKQEENPLIGINMQSLFPLIWLSCHVTSYKPFSVKIQTLHSVLRLSE